jgi:hypothetical protein
LIRGLGACVVVLLVVVLATAARSGRSGAVKTTSVGVRPADATSTTAVRPTQAELEHFMANLPDCVPVGDSTGALAGCALRSEMFPPNESPANPATPPSGMPGFPVYDHFGGTIVGYEVGGDGFIPNSVADDPAALAHLEYCLNQLRAGVLGVGCTAALQLRGIADPAHAAHQAVVERQQASMAFQKLGHPSAP